jgi:predicted ATPase/DNA-binding CsgD family transcriptional regulator
MREPGTPPASVTTFVGRVEDLKKLRRLLATSRLLTLTGPAGVGKTRLMLELARRAAKANPERVFWVDLGPLSSPELVSAAVGTAAGITERGGNLLDLIRDRLRSAPALILLDNCEHLIDGCAVVVDQLLRGCPDLRVLATSRELLRVDGELGWSVAPLALPEPNVGLDELLRMEAIALFIDRASLSRPDFRLTSANASEVAGICRHLDGLPLAIELAAARLRVMTEADVLLGLHDRFRLLVTGARTAPARQQTLAAALDWSYGLLDAEEQGLLRDSSVFAGNFSMEAVKAVCGTGPGDVLRILTALVDKSLVIAEPGADGRMRHRLLETVRAYALERLAEAGDLEAARTRHARFYLELAEKADVEARGFGQTAASALLDTEYDNLRATLDWNLKYDHGAAATLAGALAWFWGIRGHQMEGRRWLEAVLRDLPTEGMPRAKALFGRAILAHHQGDHTLALADLVECESFWRARRSTRQLAECLMLMHSTLDALRRHAAADAAVHEAVRLFRALDDAWGVAMCLNNMGSASLVRGDNELAKTQLEECLALAVAAQDDWLAGGAVLGLADALWETGEREEAKRLWTEGLVIAARLKSPWDAAFGLQGLARYAALSDPRRSVTLAGAAAHLMAEMGASVDEWVQNKLDGALEPAHARLGSQGAEVAWAEGHQMGWQQAIAYALSAAPQVGAQDASGSLLSRREAQVAELVAEGLTNRAIARRLFISERTAEGHVERIRDKLAFHSRSQIAAWIGNKKGQVLAVDRRPAPVGPRK